MVSVCHDDGGGAVGASVAAGTVGVEIHGVGHDEGGWSWVLWLCCVAMDTRVDVLGFGIALVMGVSGCEERGRMRRSITGA